VSIHDQVPVVPPPVPVGEPADIVAPQGKRISGVRRTLREARSWPTLIVAVLCLLVGAPLTILLTPQQQLTVAGQHLSVGARDPSLSVRGPAQLVQIGNTQLDILPVKIWGPLRPQLTLGPVSRNAGAAAALDPKTGRQTEDEAMASLGDAFLRWYLWATLLLLAFTLAATALAGYMRMLFTLRRQSRGKHLSLSVVEIWHRGAGEIRAMLIVAVVVTVAGWVASGALAYSGALQGLRNVHSLAQLVGTNYLSPLPEGPAVTGYTGAVIGDSRVSRIGGPVVANPTPEDQACVRSTDSLAGELGDQLGSKVLNLACPGASIESGLRGQQVQGGRELPAQVGRLKQVRGLKFVVVAIGPNDLSWTDLLKYCYAVPNCQDNLTQGEFEYRLAAFDRSYGNLLQDLNDLPNRPQIIIVGSYDVFQPDADCADAEGPAGVSGLNQTNITLLNSRNAELNSVLSAGAKKYGFDVANPKLTALCDKAGDSLGPDLQGIADRYPFHPTGIGMIRMASSVLRVVHPEAGR